MARFLIALTGVIWITEAIDLKSHLSLETQENLEPETSLTCPKFTCIYENVDTCLTSINGIYSLGDCKENFYCPAFSLQSPPETVMCQPEDEDYESPKASCVSYAKENEICNKTNPCQNDFYCKEGLICVPRVSNGDVCSYLDECEIGHVCNKGLCIEYFTVDAGKPADSRLACTSGIVQDGICAVPSATVSEDLPKKCKTNDDCTATDGATGECVCVPNGRGSSYCKLHKSDGPVKEYLAAVHDGRIERSRLLLYHTLNYPIIEKAESCYFKDAKELIDYKRLKKWANKCAGEILVVIGFILSLI